MNTTNTNRFAACLCKLSTRLELNRRWKSVLLAGWMTLGIAATSSAAKLQQIPFTPVEACGTVISTPGSYVVTQNLESNSTATPCIEITSPAVLLVLESYTLTGPGGIHATGPGIRIAASAAGVQITGSGAIIQGFNVGILNEASGVSIGGDIQGLTVANNTAQGMLISNATGVVIENLISSGNGSSGLELSQASGVIVQGVTFLEGNGGHGLWLHSSSGNQFIGLESAANKLDGIYVGEATITAGGNEHKSSRAAKRTVGGPTATSENNVFVRGAAANNGGAGVTIGAGDFHNIVVNLTGVGNGGKDAVDDNGNCDDNTWLANEFTTTAPNCIQ